MAAQTVAVRRQQPAPVRVLAHVLVHVLVHVLARVYVQPLVVVPAKRVPAGASGDRTLSSSVPVSFDDDVRCRVVGTRLCGSHMVPRRLQVLK